MRLLWVDCYPMQFRIRVEIRMPILVKDFSWRQTDTVVIIRVPLKGIHFSKADIFTFENYIKAHFSPFLFEVFLFSQVKDAESKCTKTDDELVFELLKTKSSTWEKLEADLTKSEKQQLRLDILVRFQQNAKQEREARAGRKQELQQLAVREQMSINSKTHQHIQDLKKAAREEALEEVNQWRTTLNKPASISVNQPEPELTCEERLDSTSKNIFSPPEESNKGPLPVPFPRKEGRISVKFTPRVFPTPQRQSRSAEEQEWLEKQAEAVRSTGFVAEDLTPEEQNPLWLKEKGDSFFRLGNFLGAISAYTHAITMGSKLPALFSNRGAAHLAHGNLHRTVEDTSNALDLLVPRVTMNVKSRFRCLVRRGIALCCLGMVNPGIDELQAALTLEPNNRVLIADIERVKELRDSSKTIGKDLFHTNVEELD